ncbi:MAG TPA: carbohydrate ABC transporter permease [Spirochaetales bacterium]|nr:carbohydrate ABC transporter permease [Spirochaetales bacterium]HRY53836.1 carbohydrate ABC transporter permease [Spirochaetia bacterium]HRZ65214.1 carbohydrate ABC transporter permease [Spirochaetia bacterium]
MMSSSRPNRFSFWFMALLLVSLVWLLPFAWVLLSSLKTYRETVKLPIDFLPASFTNLANYRELLVRLNFIAYYKNNLIVTAGILLPQLFFSSLAAYAFARIEFPFRDAIFVSLLVALMVPIQMILMPRYNMMIKFGWFDTYWAVIVPSIPSVTTTFFIRQQILSLPKSLDESAYMDGAGHFRIYWSIIMPLCKSALLAMGIMCVVFAWNDFLWPLVVINKESRYVLSIAVANLQGQNLTRDNLLLTAAVLVSAPIVTLFLCLQRNFVEGVAMSGIKE